MTKIIINGVVRPFNVDQETFEYLRLTLLEQAKEDFEDEQYVPEFIEITTIEGDKCIINTHAITFVG